MSTQYARRKAGSRTARRLNVAPARQIDWVSNKAPGDATCELHHSCGIYSGERVKDFLDVVVLLEFVDQGEYFGGLLFRQLGGHRADVFVLR